MQAQKGGRAEISPKRRKARLSIAIPSSLVSEVPHLREKTRVFGQVARAAAIYRVDAIHVYRDAPDESRLIRLILGYAETPQYLRRRLYPKRPELQYAGVLPPLRTPHHPLETRAENLDIGEPREGVVLAEEGDGFLVDVGVDRPLKATGRAPSIGSRTTVRITETTPELTGRFIRRREVAQYWGYTIQIVDGGLGRLASREEYDLTVATSRHAPSFKQVEPQLRNSWKGAGNILVAFGSPRRGVSEILAEDGQTIDDVFDFTVNMIPDQGTATVRTEEALHASLAILNLLDA